MSNAPTYFPMFLDLRARPVLVVGGGVVAVRKVAALLAAGARVTVVAPEIRPELRAQAERGELDVLARAFDPADVADRWLVVAATGSDTVNAAVAERATAACIPCNVVDDRERSTCIMPAVIDRAPVQIAISTGGASPVLARLIRERLESLVDESLGRLAEFAERWREVAQRVISDPNARRQYLSCLLTGTAADAIRNHRVVEADRLAAHALDKTANSRTPTGHVTLLGAGPGDPGLMTLAGLRALQEADVIVHDRLASPSVVALARRDAERINVGKFPGGGTSQDSIDAILVEQALRGRRVVRLKGGDPFIFGRGGEELDALRARGIPYAVIPGITAAVAAGAYAGIPLTDRRHAQSLRLITAHSAAFLQAYDFSDVASGRETLAVYMGVAQLDVLQARLLAAGAPNDMPVALIENATHATQRVIVSTISNLAVDAATHGLRSPAVAIIGTVAASAATNSWFGAPPLLHFDVAEECVA